MLDVLRALNLLHVLRVDDETFEHDLSLRVGDVVHARFDRIPLFAVDMNEVRIPDLRRTLRTDDPVPLRVDQIIQRLGDDWSEALVRRPKRQKRRKREVWQESAQGLGRAVGAFRGEDCESLSARLGSVQQRGSVQSESGDEKANGKRVREES